MPIPISVVLFDRGANGAPTTNNPVNLSGRIEEYADALSDRYGDAVELLDGEEFGKAWGGRVVAIDATCEEWLQRRDESQEQREHTDRSEA